MDKIGPKEAADRIRADFRHEHVDPHYQHQTAFAKDVLKELGEQESPENLDKVMRLLDKNSIEGHAYNEYPKWVQNERGERAVVNDEDHEELFMNRPPVVDDDGIPNPDHGHVDPATGTFVEGVLGRSDRVSEPFGQFTGGVAPPYEPGAVPVIERGGQKGPIASPVSDNRTDVQTNQDPMKGQRDLVDREPVTKVHYGEVVTEPAGDHNTVPPSAVVHPSTAPDVRPTPQKPDGTPLPKAKPGLEHDGLVDDRAEFRSEDTPPERVI